jgi:hypothetical protein
MLQSQAGYIDARPLTANSTKFSCNARPDHTSGSIRTSALRHSDVQRNDPTHAASRRPTGGCSMCHCRACSHWRRPSRRRARERMGWLRLDCMDWTGFRMASRCGRGSSTRLCRRHLVLEYSDSWRGRNTRVALSADRTVKLIRTLIGISLRRSQSRRCWAKCHPMRLHNSLSLDACELHHPPRFFGPCRRENGKSAGRMRFDDMYAPRCRLRPGINRRANVAADWGGVLAQQVEQLAASAG